jgi:hypothetical protein
VRRPGEKFTDYHQHLRDWQTMRNEAANQSKLTTAGGWQQMRLIAAAMRMGHFRLVMIF